MVILSSDLHAALRRLRNARPLGEGGWRIAPKGVGVGVLTTLRSLGVIETMPSPCGATAVRVTSQGVEQLRRGPMRPEAKPLEAAP